MSEIEEIQEEGNANDLIEEIFSRMSSLEEQLKVERQRRKGIAKLAKNFCVERIKIKQLIENVGILDDEVNRLKDYVQMYSDPTPIGEKVISVENIVTNIKKYLCRAKDIDDSEKWKWED